ncbi:hypothetical protein SAMN05216429_101181 [Marinobacter persicus]|uniref:Uncharacterized protein n=1 Tax=Marinobacter persicus TaxID=930118 RepID=A0A1I3PFD2_9GAMM|nr:hypothetical protein [Marinobacter persicus]GHD53816.1 hypothetical protein GCM10008110_27760 [Marinobacter persicus]SFJ20364.1 hypothetical protein SAMN05216429_101181 [Marinobacter persicus]
MTTDLTGKQLLVNWGIRQGSYIAAPEYPQDWCHFRPNPEMRDKGFKKDCLLLVQSQDCDIAAKDELEPEIELLPLAPIKPKKLFPGNQYAKSSRTLQINIDGQNHEGKVRATVTVPKRQLLEWLEANTESANIAQLTPENLRILTAWKANRYQRAALPDRFNHAFIPLFEKYADKLGAYSTENGNCCVRGLYLHLDTSEEDAANYEFALLALLKHETPDAQRLAIEEQVEDLIQELEEKEGFTLAEHSSLPGNAERESAVTVAQLTQYMKINLDYLSLREGDEDLGPDVG